MDGTLNALPAYHGPFGEDEVSSRIQFQANETHSLNPLAAIRPGQKSARQPDLSTYALSQRTLLAFPGWSSAPDGLGLDRSARSASSNRTVPVSGRSLNGFEHGSTSQQADLQHIPHYGKNGFNTPVSSISDSHHNGIIAYQNLPEPWKPTKSSFLQVVVPSGKTFNFPPKQKQFVKTQAPARLGGPAPKRGRPFKLPDAAGNAAATADARLTQQGTEPSKRRGRPPKVVRVHTWVQPNDSPLYISWNCKWQGCSAELHNLETLRRHLQAVHKKKNDRRFVPCLWGSCHQADVIREITDAELGQPAGRFEFWHRADWERHVEMHIDVLFRWLGDGPQCCDLELPDPNDMTRAARERSPWRFDEEGKEIVPSVRNQEIEEGDATENSKRRFKIKNGSDKIPVPRERSQLSDSRPQGNVDAGGHKTMSNVMVLI